MIREDRFGAHSGCQLPQNKLDRDAGPADHGLATHDLRIDLDPLVQHGVPLIVDPFLFEAGEAVALTGHLDPAGEEARRGQQ